MNIRLFVVVVVKEDASSVFTKSAQTGNCDDKYMYPFTYLAEIPPRSNGEFSIHLLARKATVSQENCYLLTR